MDNTSILALATSMQSILVLGLALVLEKYIAIASGVNPLTFFNLVCQGMANKVHTQENETAQAAIAGGLALFILVLPTILIVYLVHAFADYEWLMDILLLWILLQFRQDLTLLNNGIKALQVNKILLAKNLLQQKLLRNTQTLSPLGLTKASLESTFLRYHHQQFVTILCFLLFGPIPALGYRLVYTAQQAWNVKSEALRAFGLVSHVIVLLLQAIPSILFSFTFLLICKPKNAIAMLFIKQYWQDILASLMLRRPQHLLLASLSTGLAINTGGPLMYNNIKYPRKRWYPLYGSGKRQEPDTSDMPRLILKINQHLLFSMLFLTIIMWFLN